MTGGETLGAEAGIALGLAALLLGVAAMEVRYRPRLRIIGRAPAQGQAAEAPAPPPQMKPSAIVKKPVASDKQP